MKKANKKITMNDLAAMIKNGFDETGEQMNAGFGKVDERLNTLEQGHEDIKLRLDNVAYRFELVELQKRVDALEKKVGVRHK